MKLKLICINEVRRDDGTKVMEFTKWKEYTAILTEGDCYLVCDDVGRRERFFCANHVSRKAPQLTDFFKLNS